MVHIKDVGIDWSIGGGKGDGRRIGNRGGPSNGGGIGNGRRISGRWGFSGGVGHGKCGSNSKCRCIGAGESMGKGICQRGG